jgi:hypothetical protein
MAGREFYAQNIRFFPGLVESGDLTASPSSDIWILRIYCQMDIVIACPTARHVVIHPDTAYFLNFPLSRLQKGNSYQ